MTTDAEVACPDPHYKSHLRIIRTVLRTFRHAEVTVTPIPPPGDPEDHAWYGAILICREVGTTITVNHAPLCLGVVSVIEAR